jgi:hypothetical protein
MMANLLGWVGAALVLGAYALVSLGRLPSTSKLWAGMNIVGAGTLAWSAMLDRRWPFVALNTVWFLIGVISLVRPPKGPEPTLSPDPSGAPKPTAH